MKFIIMLMLLWCLAGLCLSLLLMPLLKKYLDKHYPAVDADVIREYDSNGNIIYRKTSDGVEVWHEYDGNGNCIYFKNTHGYESWREYDSNGKMIYYKNSRGVEEHYV